MSIVGTAKIVTNEGDGKYTITQTFVNTTDDTFNTGNIGLVSVEAWDVDLDDSRAVNDRIIFLMQETFDAKRVPIIVGSAPNSTGGIMGASFAYQETFDIQADTPGSDPNNWVDVSSSVGLNFSNSTIVGVSYYDAGPPVINGDPLFADVTWWNNQGPAWVAQTANVASQIYISGNQLTTHEMLQVVFAGKGDFTLRVGTNGELEMQVENFAAQFYVQVWLVASGPMTQEDSPIVIS